MFKTLTVCLGLKPWVAGWQAQKNPLSHDGTPHLLFRREQVTAPIAICMSSSSLCRQTLRAAAPLLQLRGKRERENSTVICQLYNKRASGFRENACFDVENFYLSGTILIADKGICSKEWSQLNLSRLKCPKMT